MRASICEVAPRDGLQNEPEVLTPTVRAELVDRLAATGLSRIEATSFVHPARVPAMADAEEVVGSISPLPRVRYAGLVLNERGYERLRTTILDEMRIAVSCTESFSQRNTGMSVAQAVAVAEKVVKAARADGRSTSVTLAVAFGCPFEGAVPPEQVMGLAERLLAIGPDELVFADTIGVGRPGQVRTFVGAVVDSGVPIGLHLHDTRNTAVLNAFVALEAGATSLDASAGGIGGCPFAPGATGNVATEHLVYLLHREGVDTGIDLDKLLDVTRWLAETLGRPLPSRLATAGIPLL